MAFITIDVGGANLDVEAISNSGGASWTKNTEGIDVSPAYSGKGLISVTYDAIDEWDFNVYLKTLDDLTALRAAAQYPKPISVAGDFARTSSSGGAPTVTGVTVQVGKAEYAPIADLFYYTAPLAIKKVR